MLRPAVGYKEVGEPAKGEGYEMSVDPAASAKPNESPFPLAGPTDEPPTTRCYWVVPGRLLAGAYAGHQDPREHEARIASFWNAGVRRFVSLMEPHERNNGGDPFRDYSATVAALAERTSERAECLRFPIRDGSVPTSEGMRAALSAIDDALAANRGVYVHCFGGMGRTGTTIACWLLRHRLASHADVIDRLAALRAKDHLRAWRRVPESGEQDQFVSEWSVGG